MDNIIEIKNLYVRYDDTCVLSDINLNIKRNDFIAIIGPNGGGKSTLLKAITGLIKPTEGSIKINSVSKTPIGYVPQFTKFSKQFPINVTEVVLLGMLNKYNKIFHKYSNSDKKAALSILKQLDLIHLKDRQMGQLSGGQLQRVLIARALASNPEILILDEPTASLDANSKTMIYSLLKDLNKTKTIIIVSHDVDVITSYVNSVACLNKELYYHGEAELSNEVIQHMYGCPVDLIAHGVPHRVLQQHKR